MEPYIPVTHKGLPAKMVSIFFGEVMLHFPDGSKLMVRETELDEDWRSFNSGIRTELKVVT